MVQLGDVTTPIIDYSGQLTTVQAFLESYFDYDHGFRWDCVIIIAIFIGSFHVGAVLAVKFLNFQKR